MSHIINSLRLSRGGGISISQQRIPQLRDRTSLCIGIGGTGVAALAELKRKVYKMLEPDNLDESVPRYNHIQFLAIDSNMTGLVKICEEGRFEESECFFLGSSNFPPATIAVNPLLNWMDSDINFPSLRFRNGAGGIRQIGRYYLITMAEQFRNKIEQKIAVATNNMLHRSIDVYVFAGVGGGTGSGCFIDTCYIIRNVLEHMAVSGRIVGYFFMPDVRQISQLNPPFDRVLLSNGYAALKELDYLKNLPGNNSNFSQNYGSFYIDTVSPPVDCCYLLSGRQQNGNMLAGCYDYCLNTASDHAVWSIAKGLQSAAGLGQGYCTIGTASVQDPGEQVANYLACRFFQRFSNAVDNIRNIPEKKDIDLLLQELGISPEALVRVVENGVKEFKLPEITLGELRAYCPLPIGVLPAPWNTAIKEWHSHAVCLYKKNAETLSQALPENCRTPRDANTESLIGRLFKKLFECCTDSSRGPFYASMLLDGAQPRFNLITAVDGLIAELLNETDVMRAQLDGSINRISLASEAIAKEPLFRKRCYEELVLAVNDNVRIVCSIHRNEETIRILHAFIDQINDLRCRVFTPLCRFLCAIEETFEENADFISRHNTGWGAPGVESVIDLSTITPRLDSKVSELDEANLVSHFVHWLFEDQVFSQNDETAICGLLSSYIINCFSGEFCHSVDYYIRESHPELHGEQALTSYVNNELLPLLADCATPCMSIRPEYNHNQMIANVIFIPHNSYLFFRGAQNLGMMLGSASGLFGDSVCVFREHFQIPLRSFTDISRLRRSYDEIVNITGGRGIHLYSRTGRGNDGTGERDWRTIIPDLNW